MAAIKARRLEPLKGNASRRNQFRFNTVRRACIHHLMAALDKNFRQCECRVDMTSGATA